MIRVLHVYVIYLQMCVRHNLYTYDKDEPSLFQSSMKTHFVLCTDARRPARRWSVRGGFASQPACPALLDLCRCSLWATRGIRYADSAQAASESRTLSINISSCSRNIKCFFCPLSRHSKPISWNHVHTVHVHKRNTTSAFIRLVGPMDLTSSGTPSEQQRRSERVSSISMATSDMKETVHSKSQRCLWHSLRFRSWTVTMTPKLKAMRVYMSQGDV